MGEFFINIGKKINNIELTIIPGGLENEAWIKRNDLGDHNFIISIWNEPVKCAIPGYVDRRRDHLRHRRQRPCWWLQRRFSRFIRCRSHGCQLCR